jgi:DNA-binding HxlR family transcriptional regulator
MSEPDALQWSADNCTIGRALDVIGDRWSLLILREVFQGIRRFDQLTIRTSIPRQMLTDRLDTLTADGLLRREPYQELGQRRRHEYRLTDKGLDLYPVLLALQTWGNTYLGDADGPPIEFIHRDCAEPVDLLIRCYAGHEIESNRQVGGRPGPGARRRTPEKAAT